MPFTKGMKRGVAARDDSPEPGPSKRDKYSSDEEDVPAPRKGKCSKMSKMSKKSPNVISKQSGPLASHQKPAELFRKDLISAMKMADTEILYESEYVVISDPWRQEWEKGVQVPVNEEEIPPVSITELKKKHKNGDFKLPPRKYLHEKNDETYQAGQHELTGMQELADQIVRYDLDDQDVKWLELVNEDREEMGLQLINEWNLERMIEELENQCYMKTNALKKTEEGLGIEYDEDVACDVCRMLESEDTNEMVFCDGCDICVHQACYGIQTIPEGTWLCRICALGIKPMCLLCPKRGGAMKSTKSGTKWTHVSCALWIPEVSIGCPEKMEPITKISNIPPSRWALVCCLCKERVGACIQCSVKQCKTAFHVSCGFAHNLDMKTIVDDTDDADGIHLRAYCPKHTKNRHASDTESPKKEDFGDNDENDISEAEIAKKRAEKLKQLEEEFYTLVNTQEISTKFFIPEEAVDVVSEYWKLKRKVNNNKPLITPKMEEEDQMQKQQKDSLSARMKMFVHLRQDLERARNLCYMISKREKTKRQLFKMKESVFRAQVRVLTHPDLNLNAREAEKVRQVYHFDSIYSDYGVMSARSSKQPRENLFTLENLKTPKDFDESGDEAGGKVTKQPKSGKSGKKKDNLGKVESPAESVSGSGKTEGSLRGSLFSTDSFKMLDDSTAESSEDELLAAAAKSSTLSSQMSRLGKVKLKEIQEKQGDGEIGDIKAVPESPKKFVPSSDLKKKLTSILQSKNMLQQRHEKSHSASLEPVNETLHVDIENSDSEILTSDNNTDLMSPADQPRNLFDQFRVQGKPMLSSPDAPEDSTTPKEPSRHPHKKWKKRKHNRSPHKHKKTRLVLSPSDKSGSSTITIKREIDASTSGDGESVSASHTSQLLSDDTDHDTSLLSPTLTSETPDTDHHNHRHSSRSPSKSGKGKKKKSRRNRDKESSSSEKSLRSSSKKQAELSPSPLVNPDSVYATLDGDIYVPSGKIQVTERTIVLDDPKEEDKTRLRSKLRLKKQSTSPVKGVVSYEVVKDEDDRHDILENDKLKGDSKDTKNIFDRVMDAAAASHSELSDKAESEVSSFSHRSETKPQKIQEISPGPRTRQKKVSESDISVDNVKVEKEVEEVKKDDKEEKGVTVKKDLFNVGLRRERRKRRATLKSPSPHQNDEENGYSSDENFRPKGGSPKIAPINKSPRPRRTRTARQKHPDETDGDDESDDFAETPTTRRKCIHNHNTGGSTGSRGVKLKPLPNKPELTALLDKKKLVVKEDLKRRVGDRLGRMLKRKGRWGGSNGLKDSSQSTLDKFFRTSSSENVFSKPDVVKDPNAKRLSLPLARCDLSPLRVNKSSSINAQNDTGDSSMNTPVSPIKMNTMTNNIFGAHSSPRGSLSSYRIPRKSSLQADQNKTPGKSDGASTDNKSEEPVFGDVDKSQSSGLKRQLSFEDVRENADLAEVVKTPSKCDPSELTEDRLDGHRSYRSQSPPSSEGSGASSRLFHLDSREGTPSRRVTRSQINEESPATRTRKREGLLKAPQLKLS